ncbi:MAG: type II secretion system F family protein [Verrucomicrobiales bacterium]|nr:MAG: type II secretion system F family protein [Verrucomicrobiaceae bacterium]
MLKKVALANTNTGRTSLLIVDTDTDEKAVSGAGKAANEIAKVSSICGLDECVHRLTTKKGNVEDRAALFAGVARCLERNIPTVKSFELQANRVKSPRYRGIIAEVAHQISVGDKVSDALMLFPSEFGPEIIALIQAGEESGRLPEIFAEIGKSSKKTLRIIKKLKKGMIYPGIVITMGVSVVITMSYTLVPAVSKLYGDLGADLPGATIMMMNLSDVLINKPYVLLFPIAMLIILLKSWSKIMKNSFIQKVFAHIPAVGGIVRKSSAAVAFRCLALLLESGVRISKSLKITADSSPHIYHKEFFGRVGDHIREGLGLSESFLMESHWLGDDGRNVCGVMEIASETGSATEMLDEIADDYEEELDTIANQIDKVLEPVTIVILGALVGFLIYAIYSPIFNLGQHMLPNSSEEASPPAKVQAYH